MDLGWGVLHGVEGETSWSPGGPLLVQSSADWMAEPLKAVDRPYSIRDLQPSTSQPIDDLSHIISEIAEPFPPLSQGRSLVRTIRVPVITHAIHVCRYTNHVRRAACPIRRAKKHPRSATNVSQ